MRLLICLITYNRLKYTKRTLKSLIDTIDVPYYLVAVDNDSTDKTIEWLQETGPQDLFVENGTNLYPGRAANIGWRMGLENWPDATHLMRCDNDMEFEPKWASTVEEYFEDFQDLGQLGLDHSALDNFNGNPDYLTISSNRRSKYENPHIINLWPGNVGGPCIIPRKVWDRGIRYDESPWSHDGGPRPTAQEDARLSLELLVKGYKVGHANERLATTFATPDTWKDYPEYYKKTLKERGYDYDSLVRW